jgi:hypothetical protein
MKIISVIPGASGRIILINSKHIAEGIFNKLVIFKSVKINNSANID